MRQSRSIPPICDRRLMGVLAWLIVAGFPAAQAPDRAAIVRAEALFTEVRAAIVGDGRTRAVLFLTLAQTELDAFPLAAANDADRAFQLAVAMPGDRKRFNETPTPAPDSPEMDNALGVLYKRMTEPAAITVMVRAKQISRAIDLARQGDVECDELVGEIIPSATPEQALGLADECRRKDGTYPYIDMVQLAYSLPAAAPERRTLISRATDALAGETEVRGRAIGLMFITHAWGCRLLTAEQAERGIDSLLKQVQSASAAGPEGQRAALSQGPFLLDLMALTNPQRAVALGADHPDWDRVRKTPGQSMIGSGEDLRCFFEGYSPNPYPETKRLADSSVRGMTPAQLDQVVEAARKLPETERKIERLLAIAGGLTGSRR